MTRSDLADALKARTWTLHREAERAGLVADLVRGRADCWGYALWLRNLYPVYRVLESALDHHCHALGVRRVAWPELFRSRCLAADLDALAGTAWQRLPLLPAARQYAARLAAAARRMPGRLVPHAYTRYLGDLNGGRVLRRRLTESLGLSTTCLGFYEFPGGADLPALAAGYRRAIDAAGVELTDWEPLLDEAEAAFRCNIRLSLAVQQRAGERRAAPPAVGADVPSDGPVGVAH